MADVGYQGYCSTIEPSCIIIWFSRSDNGEERLPVIEHTTYLLEKVEWQDVLFKSHIFWVEYCVLRVS
jgi:hypothetical protein